MMCSKLAEGTVMKVGELQRSMSLFWFLLCHLISAHFQTIMASISNSFLLVVRYLVDLTVIFVRIWLSFWNIEIMSGTNCSVFGCSSCRKTKGIGIWTRGGGGGYLEAACGKRRSSWKMVKWMVWWDKKRQEKWIRTSGNSWRAMGHIPVRNILAHFD